MYRSGEDEGERVKEKRKREEEEEEDEEEYEREKTRGGGEIWEGRRRGVEFSFWAAQFMGLGRLEVGDRMRRKGERRKSEGGGRGREEDEGGRRRENEGERGRNGGRGRTAIKRFYLVRYFWR